MESPQRNVVSGCWQQKPQWDLSELVETEDKCAMEQLPSQTDIHSLISMQNRKKKKKKKKKKDQWVFERRKRQAFIFRSGCPWSGDSTSF